MHRALVHGYLVRCGAREALREALEDEPGWPHLADCAECFEVLEVLSDLDARLASLPPGGAPSTPAEPSGPPATSSAPATAAERAATAAERARFQRELRGAVQRGVPWLGIVAALATIGTLLLLRARPHSASLALESRLAKYAQETPEWMDDVANADGGARRSRDEEGQMERRHSTRSRFGTEGNSSLEEAPVDPEFAREQAASAGIIGVLKASAGSWQPPQAPAPDPDSALRALISDQIGGNLGFGGLGLSGSGMGRGAGGSSEGTIGLGHIGTIGHGAAGRFRTRAAGHAAHEDSVAPAATAAPAPADVAAPSLDLPIEVPVRAGVRRASTSSTTPSTQAPPARSVQALRARHAMLAGVQFQEPNGYFENTYVPGDPTLRALQARLAAYDRTQLPPSARNARLELATQRNHQPFDRPANAALEVYLSASERGISSERRLLLQVGLQATPRFGGRRPAMNVGIVLDLRDQPAPETSAALRALIAAFERARDSGDRFALFAAGRGPGLVAAPEAFRHGPLSVALQNLTAAPADAKQTLAAAVGLALQSVRGSDDPTAPLGSSSVIVVSAQPLGSELRALAALAQRSAIDGVPLSVFGVGGRTAPSELSALALAGQGNLRVLRAASDAAPAVDRELSALARVVARAVRLRVRLAPGVKLVEVLGARRLDDAGAERVREAERSIDLRLSRNLGIERDRGEDEEGVQIVIPSFYAGDSHVVLLDVVAPGPGTLADVSVRYKDLVKLDNGSARQSLALFNRELASDPLQLNVLKNLVSYELSRQLRAAGDAIGTGGTDAARALLGDARALLDDLASHQLGLTRDRDLTADRALAAEYQALLGAVEREDQRRFAADSLHLASRLKLQPRPEWN